MEKMIKASIGKGTNKIEFDIPLETALKVLDLQKWIREKRELERANKENL